MRQVIEVSETTTKARQQFFELLFGDSTGYICIAALDKKQRFVEEFFKYPAQMDQMLEFIQRKYMSRNIYFCPQLLGRKKRVKDAVEVCTVVWADLDTCDPNLVDPKPSVVLRTSSDRYQGFWLLDAPCDPPDAEDASRRIAYKYEAFGADRSGWDLTQLLRVPLTYNVKGAEPFIINIEREEVDERFPITAFRSLPQVPGYEFTDIPLPKELLNADPGRVFEKYKGRLDPRILELYEEEPQEDWSAALWLLERLLFESGVTREEVFVVCHSAACNKYARDKRSPDSLWKDVCKASLEDEVDKELSRPTPSPLLTADERKRIVDYESFVESYVKWAKTKSDAAPQYHEAGALTILSATIASSIKLRTSYGVIIPNLWFLILGDTTLTRKSTAMDMAMSLLLEVDEDLLLATDGSVEGLMNAIAARPGRAGVFWRDEFSGFLSIINKKDYMSGMAEQLTHLYDGKRFKRTLTKGTVTIENPILILLCGGIRGRIQELFTYEQVLSGFVPRFVFIEGETDMSRFKPLGPGTAEDDTDRDEMLKLIQGIYDNYNTEMTMHIGEQTVEHPAEFSVELTDETWARYNEFDSQMLNFGMAAPDRDSYMPTMDRLCRSTLKSAMLMAASRQNPEDTGNKVVVELDDLLRAIHYAERWREYSLNILDNMGKSVTERRIEYVNRIIKQHRDGIKRSAVMQRARLTAYEATAILETLEQRGEIRQRRVGKGFLLTPLRIPKASEPTSK